MPCSPLCIHTSTINGLVHKVGQLSEEADQRQTLKNERENESLRGSSKDVKNPTNLNV